MSFQEPCSSSFLLHEVSTAFWSIFYSFKAQQQHPHDRFQTSLQSLMMG